MKKFLEWIGAEIIRYGRNNQEPNSDADEDCKCEEFMAQNLRQ
jgi:hypothetical protein